jgi:hypothetical protein
MRPGEWIIILIELVQSIIGRGVESLARFSHTPESIKIRFLMAITSLTEGEEVPCLWRIAIGRFSASTA